MDLLIWFLLIVTVSGVIGLMTWAFRLEGRAKRAEAECERLRNELRTLADLVGRAYRNNPGQAVRPVIQWIVRCTEDCPVFSSFLPSDALKCREE